MKLIQGEERENLEELIKQLQSHGVGGGSPALSEILNKFGVMNEHSLLIRFAWWLLSMEVTVGASGGGGRDHLT